MSEEGMNGIEWKSVWSKELAATARKRVRKVAVDPLAAMKAAMKEKTVDEKKPEQTVIAGSGGQLTPRPPSQSMKLIRQAKELADQGQTEAQIAKAMSKTESWVKASLLIAKLPASVHDAITNRQFSRTAALQLLFVPADKLEVVIEEAIKIAETEGKL